MKTFAPRRTSAVVRADGQRDTMRRALSRHATKVAICCLLHHQKAILFDEPLTDLTREFER